MANLSPYKTPNARSARRKSMDPVSEFIHLEELPSPDERFELQELLGIGTSAKVYAALDKQKGQKVAVKIVGNIAENILEIESEFRTLSAIGGQCLTPEFYGLYLHKHQNLKSEIWFVMELCDGVLVSSLLEKLREENRTLNEKQISALMKTFLTAVNNLHENDIIHRDVRASNFILSLQGDIKLIDYGSCAFVKDTEGKAHSSIGAPYWMAPEVIACEQKLFYSKYCDVWSLGITAIELAEGKPPRSEINSLRAMFQIARYPPPIIQKASEWSDLFKDFVNECLVKTADHRPCIPELMFHPFIANAEDTKQQFTLEEYLNQRMKFQLGETTKGVVRELADLATKIGVTRTVTVPPYITVKNWYLKKNPDSMFEKILPEDIACLEDLRQETIIDLLTERCLSKETFTFIGDILVSIKSDDIQSSSSFYNEEVQNLYVEKSRSDNPPHVFAIADRAFQQMLHHKKPQLILLQGISGAGKSFMVEQIMHQLSFLGQSSGVDIAKKIPDICFILDAFGSSRTITNCDASITLKSISVTFTQTGKVTGAVINSVLLDVERLTSTPQNESNFNIFYYVYEGLKAEKKLKNFGLEKFSEYNYLSNSSKMCTKKSVEQYCKLVSALQSLLFTEEEISAVFKMISTTLLLGNIKAQQNNIEFIINEILNTVSNNPYIKREECVSVFSKIKTVEEVLHKKNALAQFLYLNLFNWIVQILNRQLSFSRLVLGDNYSVSVIDLPGFQNDPKTVQKRFFHLTANIINDVMCDHIQQLMFFRELKEYEEENVDVPFPYENSNIKNENLFESNFDRLELLKAIQKYSEDKQRKKDEIQTLIKSLKKQEVSITGNSLQINHIFGKTSYDMNEIINENSHMSDFRSIFISTSNQKKEPEFYKFSKESSSNIEKIQQFLLNTVQVFSEDFPHVVICLKTENCCAKNEDLILQVQMFKLQEMAILRQKGYARRLNFCDFLNRYKFLAFDFNEEVEFTKDNCRLLLIRLKMTGWEIGQNKVFLKYYAEEYLTRLYEVHVKKIVKVQAIARRFIVKLRSGIHKS